MLRITGLQKGFGGQRIFGGAHWFVERRDRVGLIGANGSGKSTLLKIIAGEEHPDRGVIERPPRLQVGYLAQRGFLVGTGSVREEARQAFAEVLALQAEESRLTAALAVSTPADPAVRLTARLGHVQERLSILGAEDLERRIHHVLVGLGFRPDEFDRPVTELSGGWQMRVALARILLERPQLLLLDEPTNHLDLEAREWLEGYLQAYPYAYVLVSHDRHFLDVTVKRVTEIVDGELEEYVGGYSTYLRDRERRFAQRQKAYEQQQAEIRRLETFIARNRANKRLASRTHSRMLVLEKMERLAPPMPLARPVRIRYPECPHSGKLPLELHGACKAYGSRVILEKAELRIVRGSRVAVVGPNGAGKSTLMRLLAGSEALDRGERVVGYRVQPAFFAQDEGAHFDRRATVLETLLERAPTEFVPHVRGLLGAFLFSGDAVTKRIAALSGGELNRLAIAALLVRPANLLLLDEPTNHLDIAAKDALLASLEVYPGTVVFVSHDRHFLEALSTHVVEVGAGRLVEYPGSYGEFLWARAQRGRTPSTARDPGKGGGGVEAESRSSGGRGGRSTPRPRAAPGPSARRRAALEAEIESLEGRQRRFTEALGTPVVTGDPAKVAFYAGELEALGARLGELYAQWEALSEAGEAPSS